MLEMHKDGLSYDALIDLYHSKAKPEYDALPDPAREIMNSIDAAEAHSNRELIRVRNGRLWYLAGRVKDIDKRYDEIREDLELLISTRQQAIDRLEANPGDNERATLNAVLHGYFDFYSCRACAALFTAVGATELTRDYVSLLSQVHKGEVSLNLACPMCQSSNVESPGVSPVGKAAPLAQSPLAHLQRVSKYYPWHESFCSFYYLVSRYASILTERAEVAQELEPMISYLTGEDESVEDETAAA